MTNKGLNQAINDSMNHRLEEITKTIQEKIDDMDLEGLISDYYPERHAIMVDDIIGDVMTDPELQSKIKDLQEYIDKNLKSGESAEDILYDNIEEELRLFEGSAA